MQTLIEPNLVSPDELVVDNFAGGGGASIGISWAIGRSPDFAVNHDKDALIMHEANHPETEHLVEDVWNVDPWTVCAGREVALAWFSPDCKHFSRAKGGKPRDQKIRGLAWVAVRWAKAVKPKVIMLENVREFQTWGPLDENNMPDPDRKGETFHEFVGSLRELGYEVEWNELDAANYGAPTHRKRLFLIARCDNKPIVWPEKTHGPGLIPYRTAAECIDWSIECPSIFTRKRPLADKTMKRIAAGIKKFVVECEEPFLISVAHGESGGRREYSLNDPLGTVTGKGNRGLVVPYLAQTGYGERKGQDPRVLDIQKPLGTVVAGGVKHALVAAFIAKHFGGQTGADIRRPLPTTTTRGTQNQLVTAFMTKFYGTSTGADMRVPFPAITAGGNHLGEVRAFLIKYYGNEKGAQAINEPIHTITSKERHGIVMVMGEEYQIVDIGMRMLTPRELARAQGFPEDYVLTGNKTNQVAKIGNSVCPHVVKALVEANLAA